MDRKEYTVVILSPPCVAFPLPGVAEVDIVGKILPCPDYPDGEVVSIYVSGAELPTIGSEVTVIYYSQFYNNGQGGYIGMGRFSYRKMTSG